MSCSLTTTALNAATSLNGRKAEKIIFLDGESLIVEDLVLVADAKATVGWSESSRQKVAAARKFVEEKLKTGDPFYGINTGFGRLAHISIPAEQLAKLQLNLIRSHCCGVGNPLSIRETRALVLLRANVLAKGYSGVRPFVIETA